MGWSHSGKQLGRDHTHFPEARQEGDDRENLSGKWYTTFSYEAFIQRVNSDLANDFGNLVSRTLTLVAKNFSNGMPYPSAFEGRLALDQEL